MPDLSADVPAEGVERSRRWLLGLGLAAGGTLWTGCTLSDPRVRGADRAASSAGTQSAASTPTPSPPGSATPADATAELALAAGAALVARGRRISGRQRDLLELLRRTHEDRATALAGADPTARPPAVATASGAATPPAPAGTSLATLADAERRLAGRYRTAALASSGLLALFWGSMSVASTRFGAALDAGSPPASPGPRAHRPLTPVSDAEAVAALVAALHATVYGYQLALGSLPVSSSAHERALRGLRDRRALQDRLTGRLVDAGVEVPAAAPAYDPGPEVRDAATAGRLVRRMEVALLPFCGLWLASAGRAPDRRSAFDALAATAATAGSWGASVQAWPGWQD